METHEYIVEMVHRYLTGQMTRKEVTEFEQNLQTDTKFLEELKLQKGVDVVTRIYRQMELRAELNDIADRINQEPSNGKSPFLFSLLLVAASAIILAGIWFLTRNNSFQSQENKEFITQSLFDEYIEPFELDGIYYAGTSRSDHQEQQKLSANANRFSAELRTGMDFYVKGNYEKAIAALSQINDNDAHFYWANLLLGISYLQIGEATAALMQLKSLNQASLEGEKYWYLGMAYLKLGKFLLARQQFENSLGTGLLNVKKKKSAELIIDHLKKL